MMGSKPWEEPELKILVDMWAACYSAGVIAKKLGRTKNAVVGKAHRMELDARESPIRTGTTIPKPRKRRQKPEVINLAKHTMKAVSLPKVTGEARRPIGGICQWIEHDPTRDDSCKCGAKPAEGSVYCPDHLARAYTKSKPWEPKPSHSYGLGRSRNI